MGLACSNIRLLTLTARKADCEYNISIDSMEKMALTREQSSLSQEYYAKLKNKSIAFYHNGKYNQMTYQYLMGRGKNIAAVIRGNWPLKDDNSMILTDYNGSVVLNKEYADVLKSVLGDGCMDGFGRGTTFSKDKIPAILAKLCSDSSALSANVFKKVMDGGQVPKEYSASIYKSLTGEDTGKDTTVDVSEKATAIVQKLIDFYSPIFLAAAANGWTTEYNNDMSYNDNYISDALVSGTFQLAQVDDDGGYNPDASLTYFCMEGLVIERQDSDVREEITAWYNSEKERISEKEDWLDIEIQDLSTELEAINTEIESVKSFIDNNIETVFDWGSS